MWSEWSAMTIIACPAEERCRRLEREQELGMRCSCERVRASFLILCGYLTSWYWSTLSKGRRRWVLQHQDMMNEGNCIQPYFEIFLESGATFLNANPLLLRILRGPALEDVFSERQPHLDRVDVRRRKQLRAIDPTGTRGGINPLVAPLASHP
jgi:hypothetical protein